METDTDFRTTSGMPLINERAPDFSAITTHGEKKLSDYLGGWLVFFSHPADFTPVCTSEFIGFAKRYEDFKRINCELLGLSIDSNYSHLAWLRSINEKFGVRVDFPLVEDVSSRIACLYGMVHAAAGSTTVRAVFVIDDKGIIRAILYYPMTNGRSVDEILRLVTALQISDANAVATPEGWKPGDKVIVPPPQNIADAEKRLKEGYECQDWYFCKKDLPKEALKKTA